MTEPDRPKFVPATVSTPPPAVGKLTFGLTEEMVGAEYENDTALDVCPPTVTETESAAPSPAGMVHTICVKDCDASGHVVVPQLTVMGAAVLKKLVPVTVTSTPPAVVCEGDDNAEICNKKNTMMKAFKHKKLNTCKKLQHTVGALYENTDEPDTVLVWSLAVTVTGICVPYAEGSENVS